MMWRSMIRLTIVKNLLKRKISLKKTWHSAAKRISNKSLGNSVAEACKFKLGRGRKISWVKGDVYPLSKNPSVLAQLLTVYWPSILPLFLIVLFLYFPLLFLIFLLPLILIGLYLITLSVISITRSRELGNKSKRQMTHLAGTKSEGCFMRYNQSSASTKG